MALLLATSGLAGQQHRGAGDGPGPWFDSSQLVTFQGPVVQLVAGLGQGMPELQITASDTRAMSFTLGPYWYLQEAGFAADAGDAVEVSAYPCVTCESGFAVAVVVNQTKALTLTLRTADGTPLWAARQQGTQSHSGEGGNGTNGNNGNSGSSGNNGDGDHRGDNRGRGGCETCEPPDLSRVTTFTGSVASFQAEPGEGTPTVTMVTPTGDVTILVSPFAALQRAGFTFAVGQTLEITAAPVERDDVETWLALVVKDTTTGLSVVLRDPSTGLPPSGRGRR